MKGTITKYSETFTDREWKT